jgi:acetyltransferase-like isoleucine patch superfamily enzyme
MATTVEKLKNYSDTQGNRIEFDGPEGVEAKIIFRGTNNRLFVHQNARIGNLEVHFDCNNASCSIMGTAPGIGLIKCFIRLGEDSAVTIGESLTSTERTFISAAEGAAVTIGNDCMLATGVTIRADDAHPIFDVSSGERINPARDITIGNHVWIAQNVTVLGGTVIGDGTVVGAGGVVKSLIPNNCIATGTPVKVTRTNIAWERPHLTLSKPYYKNNADAVKKSAYWNQTVAIPPLDE